MHKLSITAQFCDCMVIEENKRKNKDLLLCTVVNICTKNVPHNNPKSNVFIY